MRVDIETCSTLSAGQTVCDIWGQRTLAPNATVALVRRSIALPCQITANAFQHTLQAGCSAVPCQTAEPHQLGRWSGQAICLGHINAPSWGIDMQEADISTFWEAMISALLKADMVSPLNSPANPV